MKTGVRCCTKQLCIRIDELTKNIQFSSVISKHVREEEWCVFPSCRIQILSVSGHSLPVTIFNEPGWTGSAWCSLWLSGNVGAASKSFGCIEKGEGNLFEHALRLHCLIRVVNLTLVVSWLHFAHRFCVRMIFIAFAGCCFSSQWKCVWFTLQVKIEKRYVRFFICILKDFMS